MLLGALAQQRHLALERYQHETLLWALLAPHSKNAKPPVLPGILKE